MKIYVAAVEALREKERQDETHLVHHQNWWKKLVWVPVISCCKNFIHSYTFDALLCRNWPLSPPNRLTLRIIIVSHIVCFNERLNLYQISTKFVDSPGLINIVSWMDDVFWSEHCKV